MCLASIDATRCAEMLKPHQLTFHVNDAICEEKPWKKPFTKSFRRVFQPNCITRFCFVNIPQRVTQYRNAKELPLKSKKALVKATDKCTRRIMSVRLPQGDGNGLYEELYKEPCTSNNIVDGMIKALEKTNKGSVEKRIIRSCIFAHLPGAEGQRFIDN